MSELCEGGYRCGMPARYVFAAGGAEGNVVLKLLCFRHLRSVLYDRKIEVRRLR